MAPAIDPGELRSLLSSLSHELCRPLVTLRAGLDLLLHDPAGADAAGRRGHLETMVGLCDDMLCLTRGYLDYAGMVEGSRTPALGTFSLGAIIAEIDRQFGPGALAHGVAWEVHAHDPAAKVLTDASLCMQIVGNLASNAIKYTPAGGHVRVEGSVGEDSWTVTVADDGPGIPADSLERVFEPFFRLARDEHSRIEGNGLGLSICRELSKRLGGTITLDSTSGVGTIAKVSFPHMTCMTVHADTTGPAEAGRRGSPRPAAARRPRRSGT